MDSTEKIRRQMVNEINSNPSERELLEKEHGQVWNTSEVSQDFEIVGFMKSNIAPFVVATRKTDGVKGSLMFQDRPRYYFDFTPN